MKKLNQTQRDLLGMILGGYKSGQLSVNDVYSMLLDMGLMSTDVLVLSSFNTSLMKKMGPKSTLILR